MFIFLVAVAIAVVLLLLDLAAWALVIAAVGVIGLVAWIVIGSNSIFGEIVVLFLVVSVATGFIQSYVDKRDSEMVRRIRAGETTVGAIKAKRRNPIGVVAAKVAAKPGMPAGLLPGDVIVWGIVGAVVLLAIIGALTGA